MVGTEQTDWNDGICKADVQAPYQKVLAVLDALRGKSVVLLSAPPENAARRGYVSPYGTKLIVSR